MEVIQMVICIKSICEVKAKRVSGHFRLKPQTREVPLAIRTKTYSFRKIAKIRIRKCCFRSIRRYRAFTKPGFFSVGTLLLISRSKEIRTDVREGGFLFFFWISEPYYQNVSASRVCERRTILITTQIWKHVYCFYHIV